MNNLHYFFPPIIIRNQNKDSYLHYYINLSFTPHPRISEYETVILQANDLRLLIYDKIRVIEIKDIAEINLNLGRDNLYLRVCPTFTYLFCLIK